MRYLFLGVSMPKLTKKLIENLEPAAAEFCVWDTQVTGFGVRVAIADGASLFLVGKVLGHKQARTTEIYAHLSDDPLKLVANKTAARLSQAMRF